MTSPDMASQNEVLFEKAGCAGRITLNRPKALNALTETMVAAMRAQLELWAEDDDIAHIVVRGAGDKAFCAGGDIRDVYAMGQTDDPRATTFFAIEYRLNAYIKAYPKPYIALIDGIVMGGGVGVSVHGSHRVMTEASAFAMPEVGIGFFPDVGGTYFLPRLPGESGMYLALTGGRVGLGDALALGLATHAVRSNRIDDIWQALSEQRDVDAVLAGCDQPDMVEELPESREAIDRIFSRDSVEAILAALESENSAWATKTLKAMRRVSPMSLKITFRQVREGAARDFNQCMQLEFRIVSRIFHGRDFFEGVRALLIDRDNNPQWTPATLAAVDDAEVDAHFLEPANGDLIVP